MSVIERVPFSRVEKDNMAGWCDIFENDWALENVSEWLRRNPYPDAFIFRAEGKETVNGESAIARTVHYARECLRAAGIVPVGCRGLGLVPFGLPETAEALDDLLA